jgi:hypothetical protein
VIEIAITREQYDDLAKNGRVEVVRPASQTKPGCSVHRSQWRLIKWRDEPKDKFGRIIKSRKVRTRGGIEAMVAQVSDVEVIDGKEQYRVLFMKAATPEVGYLMAQTAGYTTNAGEAVQDGGQVPYTPDVERIVNDNLAAKREARRLKLAKLRDDASELAEDPEVKRHHDRIIRAIEDALKDVA